MPNLLLRRASDSNVATGGDTVAVQGKWGTRWRLAALLATTLIFLTLSSATLVLVRRAVAADGQERALNACRAIARQLDAWLQKKTGLLAQVGQAAVAYQLQNARFQEELRILLESDNDLLDVFLWKADGTSITGTGRRPPASVDVRQRPWLISLHAKEARSVSDPYPDLRTGQMAITLSRPVLSATGELVGVAVIDLKLSAAARHVMLGYRPGSGRVLVFDRRGRIMIDSQAGKTQLLRDSLAVEDQSTPAQVRAAVRGGEEGSFFGYPPDVKSGSKWLITYTRVPSTGWTVVSYVPPNVLLRPFNLFLRGWLLIFVATALATLLLMLLFVDRLLLPIERLFRLTKESRVMYTQVAAGDDLLDLTRSVNRLMAYLEAFPGVLNLMLGLKDGYTSQHTRQVAEFAVAIGKELGLSEQQLGELECAALLHDIGKAGVPDVILKKPGALSEGEWAAIKLHPVIGAEVAAEAGFAPVITQAIRQHHERLDGSGYPDRLRDEAIGLYARIIAVADTYHAMTSDRPYRPARDCATAQAELWDGAGRKYDPHVVQAFVAILNQTRPTDTTRGEAETRAAGAGEDKAQTRETDGITAPSPA